MRSRTKSLDNGPKFSLGFVQGNHRKDRIGEGNALDSPLVPKKGGEGSQGRPMAADPSAGPSRLDQAKQLLRRFYASSTLRLTGHKRRAAARGREPSSSGALMYTSAVGPFFEFRKPCPEELPFLPYNIHYAVEGGSEEEEEGEEESSENEWEGEDRDLRSSVHEPSFLLDSRAQNRHKSPNPGLPLICPSSSAAGSSAQPSARTSASSAILQSLTNGFAKKALPSADSPDSGLSPLEDSPNHQPTTPSAGYGSLRSSDSENQRPTKTTPAEKRFADWNELFQYLRREIVEMNVRDAQILRSLETIQAELNGVRQIQRHLQHIGRR
jgi:hypothetical protein